VTEARPARLSLTDCRRLLPPGVEIEDSELEQVRDNFYAQAEAMLDVWTQPYPRTIGLEQCE
jgi:hypothetical protein